jgi:hypothetical protein
MIVPPVYLMAELLFACFAQNMHELEKPLNACFSAAGA